MALSDQLTQLAARAKEAEDRAATANTKAKAELEQEVKEARESAQAQADQLHKSAETGKGKLSAWWDDMQRSWHQHLDTIRQHVDERRATHDLESAQRNAESAEEDAAFAIDYAYGAIEEAEYAVLGATLARLDAPTSLRRGQDLSPRIPARTLSSESENEKIIAPLGVLGVSGVLARHCEARQPRQRTEVPLTVPLRALRRSTPCPRSIPTSCTIPRS
jgi:hypothetical protein